MCVCVVFFALCGVKLEKLGGPRERERNRDRIRGTAGIPGLRFHKKKKSGSGSVVTLAILLREETESFGCLRSEMWPSKT